MTTTQDFAGLTGFQQNVLYAIAVEGGEPDAEPMACPYGLAVKRRLESWYGHEINHGRLYPNLDTLVDVGFVTKHEQDKRTNGYRLTDDAVDAIAANTTSTVMPALQAVDRIADTIPPEVKDAGIV